MGALHGLSMLISIMHSGMWGITIEMLGDTLDPTELDPAWNSFGCLSPISLCSDERATVSFGNPGIHVSEESESGHPPNI